MKKFKSENGDSENIAFKMKIISKSLDKLSGELANLQKQLTERITFVENLNRKAQEAERIASLNKNQVNAINALLSDNLEKEGKKSFRQSFIVNIVLFLLGALISAAASYFIGIYLK